MLGEKRSRAAFHGDFLQSVPEEKASGISHELQPAASHEPSPDVADKSASLQAELDDSMEHGTWKRQKEEKS